jgi:hypothetical protein
MASIKKPALDSIQQPGNEFMKMIEQLRETLQIITGKRGNRIQRLNPDTATAADCAAKINEIIDLLQ